MKKLVVLFVVAFAFISCEKHKVRKEWESNYGNYTTESHILLYEDSVVGQIYANELSISETGVGFGSNIAVSHGCSFDAYLSNSPIYDYKLVFTSAHLFLFDGDALAPQPAPSISQFNSGRSFFLKKLSENEMSFVISYDTGEIQTYTFKK